jgi:hypothetical protein
MNHLTSIVQSSVPGVTPTYLDDGLKGVLKGGILVLIIKP